MLVDFLRVWYRPERLSELLGKAGSMSLKLHLSAAIERFQSSPDPRLKLLKEEIDLAKAEGRMQELVEVLEERAHIDGTSENWCALAYYLDEANRHDEAIKSYDKALEIDPKGVSTWSNKGFALHNLGKYDAAIESYDKALGLDPLYVPAWHNEGISFSALGRYDDAIKCFDKALEIDPDFAHAWNNKGYSLSNLGRYEAAMACLDKGLEADSGFGYAWNSKGNLLLNLGRYDDALKCYEKSLEINPQDADAWNNMGNCLSVFGHFDAAVECYDKVVGIDPQDVIAWNNKGGALNSLGRYDAAIMCLDKALEIDPRANFARLNKVEALFVTVRWDAGFEVLREAFRIHPDRANHDAASIVHLIHSKSDGPEQLRQHVATLIGIYAEAGQFTRLGDGLVRSLKAINADMLSDKALALWRDLWLEFGSPHIELELPLRIFRVGIEYLIQHDDRVLLDLITTERRILQQSLGLEPADSDAS